MPLVLNQYNVVVNYNPTTGAVTSVHLPMNPDGSTLTSEEVKRLCDDLNPDKGIRHRPGVLIVGE